jgi:DNA-binding NarL/FixJ family response regulator
MAPKPVSVFACESQPVVVEGLRKAIERYADFEFAGAAVRPAEALEAIRNATPDIALIDHEDGPAPALELVAEVSALPRTQAVLWVKSAEDLQASDALQAGARGILEKSQPLETLMECLRVVASGRLWFESGQPEQPMEMSRERRRVPRLTPRERQILTLLAQGMKNAEIAKALEISPGTVKVHLMHVFEKTGARDRYELAIRSRKLLAPTDGPEALAGVTPGANGDRPQ